MASKFKQVTNADAQTVLAKRARVAASFVDRLAGLLFSAPLVPGEGLIIDPCTSIHMFGMKFAIDVVFVSSQGVVVGLMENIAPGRMSRIYPQAKYCLELPVGTISDTATVVGHRIELGEASES